MAHNDTQLFCSGLCSICRVPGDFLRRSDEGWICDSCYSKRNITMATETKKTKNVPTTVTDEMSLEIFSWAPKRVLWDALYGIVLGDSHEDRMRAIIALCNDGGSLFSKKVLAHFSFVKPGKDESESQDEATIERFTDEIPTTVVEEAPVARAASVEGPPKKKAASKKKAAAKKSKKSKK